MISLIKLLYWACSWSYRLSMLARLKWLSCLEKVTTIAPTASNKTSKTKAMVNATAMDRLAVATAPLLLPFENFRSKKLVTGSSK